MKSKIKEDVQGGNSDGKETETQIKDFVQMEEINIPPEQNEKTRIESRQ